MCVSVSCYLSQSVVPVHRRHMHGKLQLAGWLAGWPVVQLVVPELGHCIALRWEHGYCVHRDAYLYHALRHELSCD
jgi:hypothetical protein